MGENNSYNNLQEQEVLEVNREGGRRAYVYGIPILIILISLIGIVMVYTEKEKNGVVISDVPQKDSFANPFESLQITAKAAYVIDAKTQRVLFSQNEEYQLPLASLTKLITALVAIETLNVADAISIDPKAIEAEGDSGLFANEYWRVGDLISFTLISSSNDGASALASVVSAQTSIVDSGGIVAVMNAKVAEIGLSQTYFINETGLDESINFSGAYGSARDMAHLFEYILRRHPSIIESTRYDKELFISLDNFEHEAVNTNEVVYAIPGFLGGKTGFTDLAGGNLVIAFDAGLNHPIIISVLGGTKEGRFTDIEALAAAARTYIREK